MDAKNPSFVPHFWNGSGALKMAAIALGIAGLAYFFSGDISMLKKDIRTSTDSEYSQESEKAKGTTGKVSEERSGSKTTATLTAPTDRWSDPVMIPKNYWFQWDCEGCESGDRIEVMVNGDVVTDGDKKWVALPENLDPPLSLRFKANGNVTKVWVVYQPKRTL